MSKTSASKENEKFAYVRFLDGDKKSRYIPLKNVQNFVPEKFKENAEDRYYYTMHDNKRVRCQIKCYASELYIL